MYEENDCSAEKLVQGMDALHAHICSAQLRLFELIARVDSMEQWRQWGAREKLEEKYPELRGDQRPVLAHEGKYHDKPLRAGDPPASA